MAARVNPLIRKPAAIFTPFRTEHSSPSNEEKLFRIWSTLVRINVLISRSDNGDVRRIAESYRDAAVLRAEGLPHVSTGDLQAMFTQSYHRLSMQGDAGAAGWQLALLELEIAGQHPRDQVHLAAMSKRAIGLLPKLLHH